ncbi:MAG: response regulator transcription factor [Nocardiopsis sp. BM-2018]|uniref:DNA-binding NarL/FixJ family response regulator n=1 Tax=Nocardiopsis metallicus TaxID=179819 RepID=A0A840WJ08_9ACTN|nr:response regulator transcription factor [Nocardiopsis metallicus]MBB5495443.1 DNA-binding NarL/FixJ family response regulator [Nocardiopsis metallicus]QRN79054.1 MAG: response regulator transcription factor [Nocardiopsis sp. BM-2018]
MRIVIAEDNVLLSEGLKLLLSTRGHEVVAVAQDVPAFAEAVDRHRPDLALVDVRLPPDFRDEGIHAAIAARSAHPGLPVLVLSQYVERDYAGELLSDGQGGVGYLLKDRVGRVSEFVDALRKVAEGGTVMDPAVVQQLLARRERDPLESLTAREREVLALMAEGHDNTEIAERIVVTNNAVHKHIGNIFQKLDLAPTDTGHRRVRAVLTYLSHRS